MRVALCLCAAFVAGCGGASPGLVTSAIPPAASAGSSLASSGFAVLHRFTGRDGGSPTGPLLADADGDLYGVALYSGAHGDGTVFKLARPRTGQQWSESVLHTFTRGAGGFGPRPGLVRDGAGNLYGVTFDGGKCTYGCGVAFELSPPGRGKSQWRYTVLHAFSGADLGDGGGPVGDLVMDTSGNIYGATSYGGNSICTNDVGPCGVIFELTPPASKSGAWGEKTIHSFTGIPDGDSPGTGVILDDRGDVFGTTQNGGTGHCSDGEGTRIGCGIVFELTANGSAWNETILYDFKAKKGSGSPDAPLLLRPGGTLLGPFAYDITEFTPNGIAPPWKARKLYQFKEGIAGTLPSSALVPDRKGHYFGVSSASGLYGYGTIYRLSRSAARPWSETTLRTFGGGLDSIQPRGGVVFGSQGALYGAASSFAKPKQGYVFRITP